MLQSLLSSAPVINDRVRIVLRRFVYLQHLRTEATSRMAAETAFAMHGVAGINDGLPSMKAAIKVAVLSAMEIFAHTMSIIDDLKLCIIRNNTRVPFVTSDNPAVLTNRWHLQKGLAGFRGFGIKNSGAILVMPLSPRLCAIFYDGDIYTIEHRSSWLDIAKSADIVALNDHQFMACAANIYFRDWETRDHVSSGAERSASRRPEQRLKIVRAVLESEDEMGKKYIVTPRDSSRGDGEELVHVMTNPLIPIAWPTFLRYRHGGKAYSNNTGAGPVRRWCIEQGFESGSGYSRIRT